MPRLRALVSIILLSLCSGCSGAGTGPTSPLDASLNNAMFPGATLVIVGTPSNNCRVGPQPAFTWQATGKSLVFVGVFTQNVSVANGSIQNTSDNVWAWHSGMGTAREGNVSFQQGVDVVNGVMQTGVAPTPLTPGRSYVWAIWAWDDTGKSVAFSSKETFFTVDASRGISCS